MKHATFSSAFLLLGLAGLFTSVNAQEYRVYRVHYLNPYVHQGFYFSFSPGFGGGNFQATNYIATDKLDMSGGTSNLDIKVGGTITTNLILSCDLIGMSMLWPETKIGSTDEGRTDQELRQGMLGIGLTYYFMPANVFISGTLGAGGFTILNTDGNEDSDRGLGFQFKVGKEWWVSPRWGVGVSMFLLNQHVTEPNQDLNGGFLGFLLNTSWN